MNQLNWIILLSTSWFAILLIIKSISRLKFCVACVTVSTTWISLLVLKLIGIQIDPLIIGILVGQSIVGMYYFLDKRIPETWLVFRWPYLISATVLVYLFLGNQQKLLITLIMLLFLWFIFGIIYSFRRFPNLKIAADKLIACCRDW